ncbi:MAG TPA: DUF6464 family protein [Nostocaceae cyanobacterium]|nr:DUF6464 family protein [Nostocaceae cyanobacterium]
MLQTLLVIIVGLLPSLLSLWVIRKTQLRANNRIQQTALSISRRQLRQYTRPLENDGDRSDSRRETPDRYYLEGVGYLIGDISCKFNARSGYMRCAVNPSGPCQDCRHYEPRELASSEKTV